MVFKHLCFRKYSFINDCRLQLENIQKIYIHQQIVINNKMVIKSRENSFGAWAFLMGIILAVIVGLFTGNYTNPLIFAILMFLGLIVGYFVAEKDVHTFLFASASTVLASFAGIQGLATNVSLRGISVSGVEIGKITASVLGALLFLFVPATIVVAIKTVFSISKIR